jgi:hypothetical protein
MSKIIGTLRIRRSPSGLYHQVEHVSEGGSDEGAATVTPVSEGHTKRYQAVYAANKLMASLRRQGVQIVVDYRG